MLSLSSDNMALIRAMEMHKAFDGDIVGFSSARSEDDFFRGSVDEACDVSAGIFDSGFGFPAVEVGAAVRVAELREVVREHGVENAWVNRRGGLHV